MTGSETAIEASTNTNNNNQAAIVFPQGSEVEVSSDEEGFKGAWFRATIIDAKKRKKVLVEYYNLVTEDGSEQLREYVDLAHVRPLPPAVGCLSFDVGDVVDADYRDGWWTGVVKKALGNYKFRVFFDNPPDLIEFHQNQMRVHQDWVNGHWIRPKREPQMTGSHFSPGTDVEVNLDSEDSCTAWIPAIVVKENKDNTFLVKYHNPKPKHWGLTVDFLHIRPPAPRYSDRIYKLNEEVDAFCDSAWRPGEITKVVTGKTYTVTFKNTMKSKELSRAEIRPRVEWKGGKWEILSKEASVTSNSNVQEELEPGAKNITNAKTAAQLEGAVDDNLVKKTPQSTYSIKKLMEPSIDLNVEPVSAVPTSNNGVRRVRRSKKFQDGVSIESPLADMSSPSRKENLSVLATPATVSTRIRKPVVHFKFETFTEKRVRSKRLKDEAPQTYPVKRKGRPKKYSVRTPATSAVGMARNSTTAVTPKLVEKEAKKSKAELPEGVKGLLDGVPSRVVDEYLETLTIDPKNISNDLAEYKSVDFEQPHVGGSSNKRKRGRPRKLVVLGLEASDGVKQQNGAGRVQEMVQKASPADELALPVQGVETTDLQEASKRKKADVSATKSLTNETGTVSIRQSSNSMDDDDRPLSTWFGAMQSQPGIESKSLCKVADQRNGNKEQPDMAMESAAINSSSESMPEETQRLPFMKTSPVWKVIESMDVFRKMPQSPHFRPLYKCKEECREGLAIGNMVTFSGLVDKISKLQFDDRGSIFHSTLESLLDLEKQGFNVSALRGRVNELLSIKDGQEQHRNELKDAETKIAEHTGDKTKLSEEIADVARKIRELQEKHDLIKVQIEIKDIEIAKFRQNLDAVNQSINSARLDFEKLRAASIKFT